MQRFPVKEIIGGLFVLLVMAMVTVTILFVGRKHGIGEKKLEYHVFFREVGGLKEGAQVSLAGVTVGFIKEIQLVYRDNQPFVRVTALVFDKNSKQIRMDSAFGLGTVGVLGDTILTISPGSETAALLPDHSDIDGQSPFSLKKLTGNIEDVMGQMLQISGDIQKFLQTTSAEVGGLGPETKKSMEQFRRTMASLEKTSQTFSDEGTQTMVAIREASVSIKTLSDNLNVQIKKGKLFKLEMF